MNTGRICRECRTEIPSDVPEGMCPKCLFGLAGNGNTVPLPHKTESEKAFERTWAMTLLQKALASLRAEYEQKNEAAYFDQLKCFLPGAMEPPPYAELAKRLGQTEDALKMAVSRLKKRFGEAVRAEISRTVSDPAQVREELKFLLTALGG